MKLAVFFPGIGYHCDKPLLYYSEKIAKQYQYETIKIVYEGLSKDLDAAFEEAFAQTEKRLAGIDWQQYEDILLYPKVSVRRLPVLMPGGIRSIAEIYIIHRWSRHLHLHQKPGLYFTEPVIPGRRQR